MKTEDKNPSNRNNSNTKKNKGIARFVSGYLRDQASMRPSNYTS